VLITHAEDAQKVTARKQTSVSHQKLAGFRSAAANGFSTLFTMSAPGN
jgi:hypothetical protein